MTRDDIIRMARECGVDTELDTLTCYGGFVEVFEQFAALVAAAERERLAQPEPQAPRPDYRDWDYQDQLDAQEKPEQSPLDRMAENARELGLDYEPVQEPVAWISKHGVVYPLDAKDEVHPINDLQPLYAIPPRREWRGLTEEDFSAINQSCLTKLQAATSAESILKEKNNA